ncbi:hypothetical protein C8N24_3320 [Solirubrobacter pauli]|uniref:Carboxypeptidase family protein n=1 Tax=Solirubrobacter pauli TaxID=166793 RepID=A0A660LHQ7_9ACTN|nr:hypothetical protein [Solirubrobacter pauli]RKQ93453.1 hypothetical protein C8N24_3320 [Solirubrobacter pauli]
MILAAAVALATSWVQVAPTEQAAMTRSGTLYLAWASGGQLVFNDPSFLETEPIAPAPDVRPAFFPGGDGLRVVTGGVSATSLDGTAWRVEPNAATGEVSAVELASGEPLVAWEAGGHVHAGATDYGPGAFPALAADPRGAMLAWFADGVRVRGVEPQAVAAEMPGTAGLAAGRPSLAVTGGRSVVAFRDQVWTAGAPSTLRLERATESAVSADARGRVWATWTDGARVWTARSDRDVSELGAAVDLGALPASHLQVNATNTAAHVLAAANGVSYLRRVLPGLTLEERHRREIFTFSVTDAGEPVRGAVVKVRGRSGKTDRNGRVTLRVSGRKARVTATLKGYTSARLTTK